MAGPNSAALSVELIIQRRRVGSVLVASLVYALAAALLTKAARTLALSARAYHRTFKVARTIADRDGASAGKRIHIAEALSLKRQWAGADQQGFARVSRARLRAVL